MANVKQGFQELQGFQRGLQELQKLQELRQGFQEFQGFQELRQGFQEFQELQKLRELQKLQELRQGFQELQELQGFQELQELQGFQELPKLFVDSDGFPIDFLVKSNKKTLVKPNKKTLVKPNKKTLVKPNKKTLVKSIYPLKNKDNKKLVSIILSYKNIKIYSKEERTEKIRRFKDKKLRRNFNRGTLYITRQIFAISRPRQYGRFT